MGDSPTRPQVPDPVSADDLPEFEYDDVETGDRIGTGGDADVFYGQFMHGEATYDVAIKEPRFEGTISQRVVKQFQEEAETWTKLADHPNVVFVYAWGTKPVPWLGLEYMDGGSLERRLGDLDVSEALWLSGRIAEGVHHGHRHGVAHLDVKPSNVLLRRTGPGKWPYPKISDWGLAELLLDRSGSVDGLTPQYAAPEQFDGQAFSSPDDYTDIYQVGAVAYALLTGRPPFTGATSEIRRQVLSERPRPPSSVSSAVPPEVDEPIMQALSKDRDERFESVVLLQRELDRLFEASQAQSVNAESGRPTGQSAADGAAPAGGPRSGGRTSAEPTGEPQTPNTGEDDEVSLPVSRRSALAVVGLGAIGAAGYAALSQNGSSVGETAPEDGSADGSGGSNGNGQTDSDPGTGDGSGESGETPEPSGNDVTYPEHSGTHRITAEDNYWAWEFSVSARFVLEYRVENRLSENRDFDVLLYPPAEFETYRAIATDRESGVRPDYLEGSRPGTTSVAQAQVILPAGTYYLVVDNTDLSNAGDFGTEKTREVAVDAKSGPP